MSSRKGHKAIVDLNVEDVHFPINQYGSGHNAPGAEFSRWSSWFADLAPETTQTYFRQWQELNQRRALLQDILNAADLDMTAARHELQLAAQKLNYEVPYRIVVPGERGAGKSSLINALLGKPLLSTG